MWKTSKPTTGTSYRDIIPSPSGGPELTVPLPGTPFPLSKAQVRKGDYLHGPFQLPLTKVIKPRGGAFRLFKSHMVSMNPSKPQCLKKKKNKV